MSTQVLRALLEAVDLAVYSYIKPAAPHRYSLKFKDLHSIVASITTSLRTYLKAMDEGYEVASGRYGFTEVSIGTLIKDAIQENAYAMRGQSNPLMHMVLIPASMAASYTLKLKNFLATDAYLNAFKSIIMNANPQETHKVYDALRNTPNDLRRAVELSGLTPGRIVVENITLDEFIRILSKHHKHLELISLKHNLIVEASNTFLKKYTDTGDLNLATVVTYKYIAEAFHDIKFTPELRSREDFKKLLELDSELHSKGVDLSFVIPYLTEAVFISLLSLYSRR